MRIALALGSGGARGYAHIAVVEELTARGHEIIAVAGASMGALVGAAVATGKLAELKAFALTLNPMSVMRLLGPTFPRSGLAHANAAMKNLRRVVNNARIEDCQISYTAVAADIIGQQEIWITSGDIVDAVRASIAIPVLFTPVVRDGKLLLDGGCINPMPIEPLQSAAADVIVAVSLQEPPTNPPTHNDHVKLDLTHAALFAVDTMMSSIQRARTTSNPPDVLIGMPCDLVGFLDMHRAADVMEAARTITIKALDEAGL
ncbi:MAG: patatin-like phospholipase family protein [Propionibacteriaceae bacterium]|jgi:NTE family protein|nr:patatin-like phospholipase family protein [Propionibacteriaceae bacterium]